MNNTTENYFRNLGIDVHFNTLGRTQQLIDAYVSDTQILVDLTKEKQSQFAKQTAYEKYYFLVPRTKLTGFESFMKLDAEFRIKQRTNRKIIWTPGEVTKKYSTSVKDFKTTLIKSVQEFSKPALLYLSGGVDSEVVALAMIDAKKSFTPVIFHWTDSSGKAQNDEDTKYANAFCEKHNLSPLNRIINIEYLWGTPEFKQMADDLGLISPQLTTHAYMVKFMDDELPNHTHLLGGEIRYKSDYEMDDGTIANLVYANKISPAPYAGVQYYTLQNNNVGEGSSNTSQGFGIGQGGTYLFYTNTSSTGTWTSYGDPVTGPLVDAPGTFECRITKTVDGSKTGNGNGVCSSSPSTGWASGNYVAVHIFSLNGGSGGAPYITTWTDTFYTAEYRAVATPGTVVSGGVDLLCQASFTP